MAKNNFIQLQLTCSSKEEADKIADALLAKNLVACARQLTVSSKFHWQGKIESADEVLLIMDSEESLFSAIEEEVDRLHSYDTFVLQAIVASRTSTAASQWLKEVLQRETITRKPAGNTTGDSSGIKND